ncbi:hypothetical protein ONZ45_g18587 [Pleurotus djamor]|nr:hypothetical protein ONZ45_g18587 [Pleurotus djamor]
MTSQWRQLAADKKQRQQASIPPNWLLTTPVPKTLLDVTKVPESCGILTAKELQITNTNVEVLLPQLASGKWTSVEVTTAFYKRAIIAQQVTNCLTEIFVEKALSRAAELDEYLRKRGKPIGPLHGLPISIKDQINIAGLESSIGFTAYLGDYAAKNAPIIEILLELGAVPFVKTNIPQTLVWAETFNYVFGRTVNPHNRNLTSGGSSGGEGALIAMRGSPLGVGSDIGGSVRIPAGFCGLYGLRPSYHRIPIGGCRGVMEGQESVVPVLGPLCNSLAGVKTFTESIITHQPWLKDPNVLRKRWSEEEYRLVDHGFGKSLCFAILWDDGIVVPHPPITRGLEMTKKALIAAGHKVIDWKPLKHAEICQNVSNVWRAGASADFVTHTAKTGEPILSSMDPEHTDPDKPPTRERKVKVIPAYDLWQTHKQKRELREEYFAHWQSTVSSTGTGRPVDAIICPVAPYAALPHGKNKYEHFATSRCPNDIDSTTRSQVR